MQQTWAPPLGQEDPLEEETATPSRVPVWRIPWTEELAGYSPWGQQESDMPEPRNNHLTACTVITGVTTKCQAKSLKVLSRRWKRKAGSYRYLGSRLMRLLVTTGLGKSKKVSWKWLNIFSSVDEVDQWSGNAIQSDLIYSIGLNLLFPSPFSPTKWAHINTLD